MRRDVRVRVEGAMLERLLQQAADRGACFASVRRRGDRTMLFEADERSARILIGLCEQYRLRCTILDHRGLSALWKRMRRRGTLLIGVLLCCALCAWMLTHVWIVDILPLEGIVSEDTLRGCLGENGIRVGMPIRGIDTDALCKQLTAAAGDYSYVGVRRQGVRLLIEAAREIPAPQLYAIDRARDLVAACDGVVASVSVHSGKACVEIGDTVRAGQTLIRGEEDKTKEETRPVSALGEVCVRRWYEGGAEGSLRLAVQRPTGRTSVSARLCLAGYSIRLAEGETFAQSEISTERLPIGGLFIPLEIERSVYRETETVETQTDAELLCERLTRLAFAEAQARLTLAGHSDYTISDRWSECAQNGDTMRVRAVYEITTNIAIARDALIEEANRTWKTTDR